ncbi:unnamed protein product [Prorocentrum cordatum]|uniref:Uncharacterized protein n=1 Tax=Prorocentrum cordatum TaxID=2364126 RepID=A0ABN9RV97_9DINO|nr:unnamed protein product [Polarella glacialis]
MSPTWWHTKAASASSLQPDASEEGPHRQEPRGGGEKEEEEEEEEEASLGKRGARAYAWGGPAAAPTAGSSLRGDAAGSAVAQQPAVQLGRGVGGDGAGVAEAPRPGCRPRGPAGQALWLTLFVTFSDVGGGLLVATAKCASKF